MSLSKKSSGFSAVEIVLVVAVVALLGFIGWRFYAIQQANSDQGSSQTTTTQGAAAETGGEDVPAAPQINSTEDLNKAEQALDSTSTSSDGSELDSELNSF